MPDPSDDAAVRRDEVIKRMLATPPQPRKKPQPKVPASKKKPVNRDKNA